MGMLILLGSDPEIDHARRVQSPRAAELGYARTMSELAGILDKTPVGCIDDVLARMQEIDAALPRTDGIACFNKLYLAVTTNVLAAESQRVFADPRFLKRLDVDFGNLYFAALKANEVGAADTPRAWRPLFAARARNDIAPIQFALAGMNAHINRDLPEALVQTFAALGVEMARPSPQYDDYERVDALLAQTEASVKQFYLTPLLRELDRAFGDVDDLVVNWSVREARAAAWVNGEVLWRLRAHPALAVDYLDGLDGTVGFAGRGLLLPTALGGEAAELAGGTL